MKVLVLVHSDKGKTSLIAEKMEDFDAIVFDTTSTKCENGNCRIFARKQYKEKIKSDLSHEKEVDLSSIDGIERLNGVEVLETSEDFAFDVATKGGYKIHFG